MSRTQDTLVGRVVSLTGVAPVSPPPVGLSPCPEATAVAELLRRTTATERRLDAAERSLREAATRIHGLTDSLQSAHDELQLLRAMVREVQDHSISTGIRQREADRRARTALRANMAAHLLGVQLQTDPPHRGTPALVLANQAVAMADVVLWAAGVEDVPDGRPTAEEHWEEPR